MVEVHLHDMPITPTTAMTPLFEKRARSFSPLHENYVLTLVVCVSDALVAEIKRIVKESEILKYVVRTQIRN